MNIYQIIRKFFNLSFHLSFLWKSPKQWESWLRLPKPLERLMPWRLLSAASHFGLDHHLHDNYCQLKNTFCPSQNWRKTRRHMGTLSIYSFQARLLAVCFLFCTSGIHSQAGSTIPGKTTVHLMLNFLKTTGTILRQPHHHIVVSLFASVLLKDQALSCRSWRSST